LLRPGIEPTPSRSRTDTFTIMQPWTGFDMNIQEKGLLWKPSNILETAQSIMIENIKISPSLV
jgi:hypothetical protein